MGLLDGKVVFVTGAGRCQGRAHALVSAREGADIIATDIAGHLDGLPYELATQADLDDSPVVGPVHPVKGGSERHESTRTEQVTAVVRAGPADADGLVGTLDLRTLDRTRHTRPWISRRSGAGPTRAWPPRGRQRRSPWPAL